MRKTADKRPKTRGFKTKKEIAEALDVTTGTVESLEQRGLIWYRQSLDMNDCRAHKYYADQRLFVMREKVIRKEDFPVLCVRVTSGKHPDEEHFFIERKFGLNAGRYVTADPVSIGIETINKAIGLPVLFVYSHFVFYGGRLAGAVEQGEGGFGSTFATKHNLIIAPFSREEEERYVNAFVTNNVGGPGARLFEQDDYESEEWHRHENIALNLPFYCNTQAIEKHRYDTLLERATYSLQNLCDNEYGLMKERDVLATFKELMKIVTDYSHQPNDSIANLVVSSVMTKDGRIDGRHREEVMIEQAARRLTVLITHLFFCHGFRFTKTCDGDVVQTTHTNPVKLSREIESYLEAKPEARIKISIDVTDDEPIQPPTPAHEIVVDSVSYQGDKR